jgi:ParB family chromosome partitioning protein
VVGEVVALPDRPFPEWGGKDVIAKKWTGDQESYTPKMYIEAAREVMGKIDTDPASNEMAQEVVKADVYYTKEDDGLTKQWNGNIFLNPPYSHPEIKHFVEKLLSELQPGQQAVLLTNNNTDTGFFHNASKKASAICFTRGRINFMKEDGSVSSPTNGQTFFYFGDKKEEFARRFSDFGIIMEVFKNNDLQPG